MSNDDDYDDDTPVTCKHCGKTILWKNTVYTDSEGLVCDDCMFNSDDFNDAYSYDADDVAKDCEADESEDDGHLSFDDFAKNNDIADTNQNRQMYGYGYTSGYK